MIDNDPTQSQVSSVAHAATCTSSPWFVLLIALLGCLASLMLARAFGRESPARPGGA